ncbi:MAG: hypothetical protein BWK76_12975 [Desulfobulbaceae bacterium A2]|nr:MAG: hypothetical protein BWK76_12975 [Desulfobulbaceae bacterium A2]
MLLAALGLGLLATLVIGAGLAWFQSLGIPDIRGLADYHPPATVLVRDRHGKLLKGIFHENREMVRLKELPPHLPNAFVAAEDSGFWQHVGLDGWSILRAAANNLRSGRKSQGGSTITQQVTRALLLSPEKRFARKFKEAVLAYRIERWLSKEDILQIYLNEIYLGEGAYGVGAAARVYFGKAATRLSLGESAILAGLPQAPNRYSPSKHLDQARLRQRYVLNRMAEDGLIDDEAARQAWGQEPRILPLEDPAGTNGYFLEYVRGELERHIGKERLYRGGFTVWTTLDTHLQRLATASLHEGTARLGGDKENEPPQGALVVVESESGRIRALVGGRDFLTSPFNRATESKRQPGSAFKPLIYAAALERGLGPEHLIEDAPMQMRLAGGKTWRPHNYDNSFKGPTTLRDGLVFSRNIVTIKLLKEIGFDPVLRLAPHLGIHSPLKRELSLALGSCELSPLELTGAYTVFANGGTFRPPRAIEHIQGPGGGNIPLPHAGENRALRAENAAAMDEMLRGVVERGTGRAAALPVRAAGKTGTTDEAMDVWFIGYAGKLTTGVWIGHDRKRPLGKEATGGSIAAPVWQDFMTKALSTR